MEMKIGKFIVIEGLDGSGKSVQHRLLENYLEMHGYKYKSLHFPQIHATPYGEMIGRFLRGEFGTASDVNPYIVALLFALDRRELSGSIKEWLLDGNIVLIDRFVYSNIAFQCAKLKLPSEKNDLRRWILNLEFEYNKLPKPDLSIYLDVPFEFVTNNLSTTRTGTSRTYLDGKMDIHETSIKLQSDVSEEYLRLVHENDDFIAIDCLDAVTNSIISEEDLHQRIIKSLTEKGILEV